MSIPWIGMTGYAMCVPPPQVPYARHSAPLDKDDFPTDSMVQYTCFPGYNTKGFPRAMCLLYNGTAQWFGPDLHCLPRSCGPPGEIKHGVREGDTFTFTSRVTYNCSEGFEVVGRPYRYCQSNGQWSGQLPECRPRGVTVKWKLESDEHGRTANPRTSRLRPESFNILY
ncbi:protein lev-9 [Caerostris extrusa]|uniref:Protein lev-9 n=1 Tax=Caerostris extrusa TaxID=172846 RepID=A0AAV4S5J9_CAEEX|nr:protein lev-9 [Caerostris extrusa]